MSGLRPSPCYWLAPVGSRHSAGNLPPLAWQPRARPAGAVGPSARFTRSACHSACRPRQDSAPAKTPPPPAGFAGRRVCGLPRVARNPHCSPGLQIPQPLGVGRSAAPGTRKSEPAKFPIALAIRTFLARPHTAAVLAHSASRKNAHTEDTGRASPTQGRQGCACHPCNVGPARISRGGGLDAHAPLSRVSQCARDPHGLAGSLGCRWTRLCPSPGSDGRPEPAGAGCGPQTRSLNARSSAAPERRRGRGAALAAHPSGDPMACQQRSRAGVLRGVVMCFAAKGFTLCVCDDPTTVGWFGDVARRR